MKQRRTKKANREQEEHVPEKSKRTRRATTNRTRPAC